MERMAKQVTRELEVTQRQVEQSNWWVAGLAVAVPLLVLGASLMGQRYRRR
jgi:hypothetical protein